MNTIKKLYEFIPEQYFVQHLRDNKIGTIKLAFVREVINPLIIRSADAEATITMVAPDKTELVEIPPRKLKSKEKLLGLKICRKFNVVHPSVRYNSLEGAEMLNNPNSILFGDTSTKAGDTAGVVSRAIYDWAYSLRDHKDITDKLQHNALSESGTMVDEKTGKMRQSLFQTEYVLPATYFPHFITLDNTTPELLFHLLSSVLHQHNYGAQTTTNANNVVNHLVAIGYSNFEKPINSYTLSETWRKEKKETPSLESVTTFIVKQMDHYYGDNLNKNTVSLKTWLTDIWEKDENSVALQEIYQQASKDATIYLESLKMIKDANAKTRKTKKK